MKKPIGVIRVKEGSSGPMTYVDLFVPGMLSEGTLVYADESELVDYTTGHCKELNKPGGCQLHNLRCNFPYCDRKPI